jgi:hypothetical protein
LQRFDVAHQSESGHAVQSTNIILADDMIRGVVLSALMVEDDEHYKHLERH